ncbi:hypothetical protein [Dictyobacter aurantiacus]|nr:hypothetical protein [Dictyobacter aurantiacus]
MVVGNDLAVRLPDDAGAAAVALVAHLHDGRSYVVKESAERG